MTIIININDKINIHKKQLTVKVKTKITIKITNY